MLGRLKPDRVNADGLIYGFWACSSGLILAAALLAWSSLRARDQYIQELLGLIDSARDPEHDLHARAKDLCNECQDRTNAGGLAVYANGPTGLRKLVQSGDSAEVTRHISAFATPALQRYLAKPDTDLGIDYQVSSISFADGSELALYRAFSNLPQSKAFGN